MNILFINTFFEGGGAEKIARQLFYGLRERKDVNTFFLAGRGDRNSEAEVIYYKNKFPYIVNRCKCFVANNQRKHDQYAKKIIETMIQNNQIDVVHFHNVHGNYMGYKDIAEISQYCKVVWTLHDMWAITGHCAYSMGCKNLEDGCKKCGQRWIYPKIRRDVAAESYNNKMNAFINKNIQFVTPSDWLEEQCRTGFLHHECINVIHNGVNTKIFREHDREKIWDKYKIDKSKIVLMFVANLLKNPFKGIETLVKALNEIRNKSQFAVIICGHGEQLPISNKFTIYQMGYIRNDSMMSELYSAADVFLLPSIAENYPCTILESIASGTPVIGSNAGGIPEQICRETGWTFPVGNYMRLAELLESLSKEQLTNMREKCRNIAEMNFTEEKMIEEYYELYRSVLREH